MENNRQYSAGRFLGQYTVLIVSARSGSPAVVGMTTAESFNKFSRNDLNGAANFLD